jgi:predicted membrane-bound mannosyltransferase
VYVKSAAKILLYVLFFTIVTSGVFYWRIRETTSEISFNAWVIGLDITLGHIVITAPIFLESFYIASIIAQIVIIVLGAILSLISYLTGKILQKNESIQEGMGIIVAIPACLLYFSRPGLAFIGAVWFVWFLLIRTTDLQQILFGNHDKSLGWNFPTTTAFRFTLLYEQLKNFLGVNQDLATIIGFIAFGASIVLGVASLLKAIKDIGENLKNG